MSRRLRAGILTISGCFALTGAYGPVTAPCEGAELLLLASSKEFEKGNLDKAERLLRRVRATHPDCEQLLLGLGKVALARGDLKSAQDSFSRYSEKRPTDSKGYYYMGQLFLSAQNYPRADVMSELAVTFGSDDPDALYLRGKILVMKGQTEQAEVLLEKACKLAPDSMDAHFELGMLFDTLKRNSEAVEEFEKVIELNPQHAQAYDYLALNLEPLGEIERVEATYRKGLKVNKGRFFDAFLNYNYGRFLMKRNRLAEAKIHLGRAVQLASNTRAVYYERGKLNLRMKNYNEARTDLEKALRLPDPSKFILDLQIYYLLSMVYARLGQEELARKYAELSRKAEVPPDRK
ncbi:tetratricopeptide repeat protein [Acidobacteria bacterium AH-259-O06]|nr:tetratricopeptide repeat protein [Acidobacteria bacterium AH-259-O06]